MTPVLVFMDANGECYDYTYHNIAADLRTYGVDGMLQQLKSLCLYHFDGNSLVSAKYVVDAGKQFDINDYRLSPNNPWKIADHVMNMSLKVYDEQYEVTWFAMTPAELENLMFEKILKTVPEYMSVITDGKIYLAGCLLTRFAWIDSMFPTDGSVQPVIDIEQLTTA